jgi:hypothetical protein
MTTIFTNFRAIESLHEHNMLGKKFVFTAKEADLTHIRYSFTNIEDPNSLSSVPVIFVNLTYYFQNILM